MPRLLQIDSCLGVLSTGRITEGIASIAQEQGWECHIAHGARYVGKSNMISHQIGSSFTEYLHYAQSLLLDKHGLGSICATKRLVWKIENEIKPDIIHLHCIHGYYLNYQILFEYLTLTNIPVVWTFHDCWAFTGHCAHFVTAGCRRWCESGCERCPLISSYPKSITDNSLRNFRLKMESFLSKSEMTIVAVSEWMKCLVNESFFKGKEIEVINNGVDLSKFYPSTRKNVKQTVLGVASAWGVDKGLPDFIKLRKCLPLEEYDIILVGVTEQQLSELPEGIIGICKTDSVEELASLYSAATVFVNPTYADTFPSVNIEALACGTPVITYATGGSPEIIDESTGVVVPQGDVVALADAIKILRYAPIDPSNCRKRAEEYFDRNVCFRKYIDLYAQLLQ